MQVHSPKICYLEETAKVIFSANLVYAMNSSVKAMMVEYNVLLMLTAAPGSFANLLQYGRSIQRVNLKIISLFLALKILNAKMTRYVGLLLQMTGKA
jgi:hypothetical protein